MCTNHLANNSPDSGLSNDYLNGVLMGFIVGLIWPNYSATHNEGNYVTNCETNLRQSTCFREADTTESEIPNVCDDQMKFMME